MATRQGVLITRSDYEECALELPGVRAAWALDGWDGPGTVALFYRCDEMQHVCPNAMRAHLERWRPFPVRLLVGLASVELQEHVATAPTPISWRARALVLLLLLVLAAAGYAIGWRVRDLGGR